MIDDHNPFFFLFGYLNNASLLYTDCTFYSPCGGRGPRDLVNTIHAASSSDTRLEPAIASQVESQVLYVDALQAPPVDGFPNSLIGAVGSTIQCFDPSTHLFAPTQPPEIWRPEAIGAEAIESDSCQRPETLGADYRGTVQTTTSGVPCAQWGDQRFDVRGRLWEVIYVVLMLTGTISCW